MTCRHSMGDPSCTSGKAPADIVRKAQEDLAQWGGAGAYRAPPPERVRVVEKVVEKVVSPPPPDNSNFEIVRFAAVKTMKGRFLIVQVRYESCDNCAYDNNKLMIFEATPQDLVNWRTIDPHFREDGERDLRSAPPPVARFPATDEFWRLAPAIAEEIGGYRWKTAIAANTRAAIERQESGPK